MALRYVFGVFILCLLLFGTAVPVSAAQEMPESALDVEMDDPPTATLAIGDDLEYSLPMNTMEVIGRYNITIDPTENFTVTPSNLDTPLKVKRDTPIGALDAVARAEGLNYTTYYYTVSTRLNDTDNDMLSTLLVIDSIDGYVNQGDRLWFVFHSFNETIDMTDGDTQAHNLSNGETFWLIYCDLSDYDPYYEYRTARAVAGLSITVTFGEEEAVYPFPKPPVHPTPVPDDLTITAADIANLQWQEDPVMPGWLTARDRARGLTFYKDPGTPDIIMIMTDKGEWYGYSSMTGLVPLM